MFKLVEGDYYQVPAAQVQQICPELQDTVDDAVQDGTVSMAPVLTRNDPRKKSPCWHPGEKRQYRTYSRYLVFWSGSGESGGQSTTTSNKASEPNKSPNAGKLEKKRGKQNMQTQQHRGKNKQIKKNIADGETGCELTTYEPFISSFLTDAHVYLLAARNKLQAGVEAAVAATQHRLADILNCLTDVESTCDQHAQVWLHLHSLIEAGRLVCGDCEEQQQPRPRPPPPDHTGPGVGPIEPRGARGRMHVGPRAVVMEACATLGPLLAETPALWDAVSKDAGFEAMWWRLSRNGFAASWYTPQVRERIRCVVEGVGTCDCCVVQDLDICDSDWRLVWIFGTK
jgi:hypothetical protein